MEFQNYNMKKNYLPSKKFIYSILGLIILAVLFFVVSNLIAKKSHFASSNDKNSPLQTAPLTINDMLKKDSDGDGVMDWEEALWGTDVNNKVTFNGVADGDYIKQKKDALKVTNGDTGIGDTGNLTETDKFAQEFFASLTAMKQNGQVDKNTINNVSSALGQKIADPTLTDKYTNQDAKLTETDGKTEQKTYYLAIKKLFDTYSKKGIGDELGLVSGLVASNSTDKPTADKLNAIASAYEDYAQKIMGTSVPTSLISYHLQIANSANDTGIAVQNMIKTVDDPIVGLSGVSQYQKYSADLISAVGKLQTVLYNNGIVIN